MEIVVTLIGIAVGLVAGWALGTARAGSTVRRAEVDAAEARVLLDAERRVAAERLAAAQADRQRMNEQFRTLAAEALQANSEQFMVVAEERLTRNQMAGAAELSRREDAVRQLVEPLNRTLDQVKVEVATAERARLEAHSALAEQLRAMQQSSELLRSETGQLVTALRSSQVRGRWGEIQLRRVVEAAGMVEHVDFVEQSQVRTDGGQLRPDMVVRLAGGKNVVVDAKVAFLGYLDAMQTDDDAVRAERLAAHARHVRKHIDDLAAKEYWEQLSPAPEFVVMFLPAEAFLHAALEADGTLVEHAMGHNVVLATPMTLVAMLRTVAYAWRQDALAANAQQVLTLGRELHGRLATLGGHVGRLGRQLDGAVRAYNETVSSLESRVLVSARRLAELKVTDDELDTPAQLDRAARQVQAPELVASDAQRVVAIEDLGHPAAEQG
jgi:DNA recombination protein RmuC